MLPNLYSLNSRLDNEIMQLQQEINAVDAVRANLTRNRNKGSPTVPEVGLNFELFLFLLMLAFYSNKASNKATSVVLAERFWCLR
jgi:hypothetical protein